MFNILNKGMFVCRKLLCRQSTLIYNYNVTVIETRSIRSYHPTIQLSSCNLSSLVSVVHDSNLSAQLVFYFGDVYRIRVRHLWTFQQTCEYE